MKIQVIGSGCPTCKKLYEITKKAVAELAIKEKVEYIAGPEGIQTLIEMGAMASPVLAINGEILMVGFTDDKEKIKELIKEKI